MASRATILASLLPADADRQRFCTSLESMVIPWQRGWRFTAPSEMVFASIVLTATIGFSYCRTRVDSGWLTSIVGRRLENVSVLDPTAGGGSIPFEAMRFGLYSGASDLNPVAALIMKATIEWPARFCDHIVDEFSALAARLRRRVEERLCTHFPQTGLPGRVDMTYLWARTVMCPYCDGLVPLSPNWRLAPDGMEVRLRPEFGRAPGTEGRVCSFEVVTSAREQSAGTVARGDGTDGTPDDRLPGRRRRGLCPRRGVAITKTATCCPVTSNSIVVR